MRAQGTPLVEVPTGLPPLVRHLAVQRDFELQAAVVRHRDRPLTRGMQAFLALAPALGPSASPACN